MTAGCGVEGHAKDRGNRVKPLSAPGALKYDKRRKQVSSPVSRTQNRRSEQV